MSKETNELATEIVVAMINAGLVRATAVVHRDMATDAAAVAAAFRVVYDAVKNPTQY